MERFNCSNLFLKCLNLTFFFAVIITVLLTSSVEAAGNSSWGEFPKASSNPPLLDYSYDGLESYFKFTRSFVYNSLKLDTTDIIDILTKVKNGGISDSIPQIIKQNIGFLVAVAVGVIFIILFIMVGICFSCCRMCGKCGGKRIHKNISEKRRKVYAFLLLANVLLSIAGIACMLASSVQIDRNIKHLPKTIKTTMNFINYHIEELYEQVNFIGNKTETLLMDAIEKNLDDIGDVVGKGLQTDIDTGTNIKSLFDNIRQFDQKLGDIQSIIHDVNSSMEHLESAAKTLNHSLIRLSTGITKECSNCNVNSKNLKTDIDTNNLPDLTSNIKLVDDLAAKGLSNLVKPSEKTFNEIPELVQNKSQGITKEVKKVIGNFRTTIKEYKDKTKNLKTQLNDSLNGLMDLKKVGIQASYENLSDKYGTYWTTAFASLGCLTVLIPVLQLVGLIFGTFGNGDSVKPTQRNCLSNCGGILLMISVGLMFIFGWIFMLITTVTYIPGSLAERLGCSVIRDIDEGSLDKIIHAVKPNENFFGDVLPIRINLSIADAYSNCKEGQSIPKALKTDKIINNLIDKFQDQIKIKEQINSVSVDLSDITIMNDDVKGWFDDMKSGLDINFTRFTDELQKGSTQANLSEISNNLTVVSNTNVLNSTALKILSTEATRIQNNEQKNVEVLIKQLKQNITLLESNSNNSLLLFEEMKLKINISQDFLNNKVNDTVINRLEYFADKLLGIWNSFVGNIKRLIGKMLSCKPAVDIAEFLSIGLACGTVDAFNGIWFGFGWYIMFFIPGIILSVKLAKHYRRMLYVDELDSSDSTSEYDPAPDYNPHLNIKNNKVGHF